MIYEVIFDPDAAREFDKLPEDESRAIIDNLEA